MKTYTRLIPAFIFLLILFAGISVHAQVKYSMAPSPELKISGGSSLHDWDMVSSTAKGEGLFLFEGNQFKGVSSLNVEFDAETLKSGTKGLDNNAYKALKTDKNKQIKFVLKELTKTSDAYTAKGDLTIAGFTKQVSFPAKLVQTGNKIQVEGEMPMLLTDFKIDPPTALLGTVKTKNEAVISFKATFQPHN
jgi:polyisoprenoid-binding protein YceI